MGLRAKALKTSASELKNICNKRHSHTREIRNVPLTGIHSIRHPEEQFFFILIYEIIDSFRMLYIILEFPKVSSMEEVLKNFFFVFRGSRTYANVYRPEKKGRVCRAHI